MKIHRVKVGESVYSIAREYGINPIRLMLENELESPKRLAVGRELLILTPTRTYTAKHGDTLDKIAAKFATHKDTLLMQNPELYEAKSLYTGQVLTVKNSRITLGMGIANGYLYPGYTRERLLRCMPYLSYVTVCSAVAAEGKIRTVFDDSEALELIGIHKKIPLLRIYTADDTSIYTDEFTENALLLAKARGYEGITLTESAIKRGYDREKFLELRKRLIDKELLFVTEKDICPGCGSEASADMTVLSLDKIHLEDMPSFREGEEKRMTRYAEECCAECAFIDISPFALINGKYKEKVQAFGYADKYKSLLDYDAEKKILRGTVGQGRRECELICESLENTKAKLELVAELGYLGISFDIMRTHMADLLIFAYMFDRPPTVTRRTVCNPKD